PRAGAGRAARPGAAWSGALAGLRLMHSRRRGDSRCQRFEARTLEKPGKAAEARALMAQAARSPTCHGFLAADRLAQPYALCPWKPAEQPGMRAEVARDPALVRALSLYRINQASWATRDWNEALGRFDYARRRIAVALAQ